MFLITAVITIGITVAITFSIHLGVFCFAGVVSWCVGCDAAAATTFAGIYRRGWLV